MPHFLYILYSAKADRYYVGESVGPCGAVLLFLHEGGGSLAAGPTLMDLGVERALVNCR